MTLHARRELQSVPPLFVWFRVAMSFPAAPARPPTSEGSVQGWRWPRRGRGVSPAPRCAGGRRSVGAGCASRSSPGPPGPKCHYASRSTIRRGTSATIPAAPTERRPPPKQTRGFLVGTGFLLFSSVTTAGPTGPRPPGRCHPADDTLRSARTGEAFSI